MAAGISFSPIQPPGQTPPSQTGSPLQDAIKILSFRLPTVVGASGVSPLAGGSGDNHMDQWLMNLFKGILPADQPTAASSPFGPTGPQAPPTFGTVPTGGPPPMAPPPNIVTTPPDTPKAGLPPGGLDKMPGVPSAPPADVPSFGPPDWRTWGGGSRFGG